ncbi:4-hydroxythreonine-4-phosphate dehydrogenase PdxA [Raineyella fluvialis]|uniref:4-hydroxythreonine-4-phosphate dehydrogenase PdxA n=1 Tax=Raineyella fluvialis TaxID=2662261 RepID=A0A5Q2FCV8_9ACTN|nr:4-hydroxythreonine-4-phosphate dehydrogenase PdxA [Raineyella fluvialis]QGF23264.1 4-hydroxythreonine-4-phosphate dehydrogenase PdxA [Raineyella fluvialis]
MQQSALRPVTAITLGDPAGIGPEIVLQTVQSPMIYEACRPFVIGSRQHLERAAAIQGTTLRIHEISAPEEAAYEYGTVDLLDTHAVPDATIEYGVVQADAARQAYSYLEKSIELGLAGRLDAVSTAPINKAALKAAHIPFIGHTEIFNELTHSPYALTMFNVHKLRVFFLTRHVSVRQACDLITRERTLTYLKDIDRELRALGFEDPSIAVAALNPHGGEGGMFGTEEVEHLIPAVEDAKKLGINARGPLPGDSVFAFGLDGHHDCILSLYHDQGHIACKTLDFEKAVTVTLGLPFMRSSVDHGTAFDIAGKGVANGGSMIESTRVAAEYAGRLLSHREALAVS